MAVSGNKFTMEDSNTETFTALCGQLAGLIKSASSDFEDIVASGNVNRWAKHKPFRYNDHNFGYDINNPAAAETRRATARKEVNQAIDFSSALISESFDATAVKNKYESTDIENGWEYLRPRGKDASPIEPNRIRDFDGYLHDAMPFIQGFTAPSVWSKDQNNGVFQVSFMKPEESDEILTYKDFPLIMDCYLGVVLISSASGTYRLTQTQPISSAGLSLPISTHGIKEGTYTMYPFFAQRSMGIYDGGEFPDNKIYTVPRAAAHTIKITASSIVITITAQYMTTSTTGPWQLSVRVDVTNTSAGAKTLTNNSIFIRQGGKSFDDVRVDGEILETIADTTINAGATKNVLFKIYSISSTAVHNYTRVWVSLQNSYYLENSLVMQNITNPDFPQL